MREDNIFVTGNKVSGESMIGYEQYLETEIKEDDFFFDMDFDVSDAIVGIYSRLSDLQNCSVVGLLRSGKSSLVDEAKRRLKKYYPDKFFFVSVNALRCRDYGAFLVEMMSSIEETAKKNGFMSAVTSGDGKKVYVWTDEDCADCQSAWEDMQGFVTETEGKWKTATNVDSFQNCLEQVFTHIYSDLHKRIILFIDEFDAARNIFTSTADFEYLRDLSNLEDAHVCLCIISRRQIYMIENRNDGNSTFHGIINTTPIQGFWDEDMEKYYSILEKDYEISLGAEQKERLEYLCGRSPYLCSLIGHNLVEGKKKGKSISIDRARAMSSQEFNDYYDVMYQDLSTDKIYAKDRENPENVQSTLQKLVGIVIGPCIDITTKDIEQLNSLGYLRKKNDGSDSYYACSEYFTAYLREKKVNSDSWSKLMRLEHLIKYMVRKEQQRKLGLDAVSHEHWCALLTEVGAESQIGMYETFILSSLMTRKQVSDILDVCSMDIAISMMQYHWEDYRKYFGDGNWSDYEEVLRLCSKARNPLAHNQPLTAQEKISVHSACDELVPLLMANHAEDTLEMELTKTRVNAIKEAAVMYANATQKLDLEWNGMEVTFVPALHDSKAERMRGYFEYNGKRYRANLKQSKLSERYAGVPMTEHLAVPLRVKISVNNNSVSLELLA